MDSPDRLEGILWKDRALSFLFNTKCGVSFEDILTLVPIRRKITENECFDLLEKDERLFFKNNLWHLQPWDFFFEDMHCEDIVFIITDIETTGNVPGKDCLIELAAIKYQNGRMLDSFESLVYTDKKIPYQIQKITNITNADLKGAPNQEEVLSAFQGFFNEGIFCAHNMRFDFFFLQGLYDLRGSDFFGSKFPFCTLKFAEKLLPKTQACGISSLSKKFGIDVHNRHRAMGDVLATQAIFKALLEKMQKTEPEASLHRLLEFHSERKDIAGVRKSAEKKMKKFSFARG